MHVLTCRRCGAAASEWFFNIQLLAMLSGSHCDSLIHAGEIYVQRESQERT